MKAWVQPGRRSRLRGLGWFLALPLLGTLGCGPGSVFLEAPEVDGARSFLYGVEQAATLEVYALDLEDQQVHLGLGAAFSPDEALQITRVAFLQTLEARGWASGRLEPSDPPHRKVKDLDALRIDRVFVSPDDDHARFEAGPSSPQFAEFLVRGAPDCPAGFRDRELTELPFAHDAVSPDASTAVVLDPKGLVVVRDDSSFEHFPLPEGEEGGAIARAEPGEVWVATSSAIRRFDPASGGFDEPTVRLDDWPFPAGLMVRDAAEGREFWVLTEEGDILLHREGQTVLELMHQISPLLFAGRLRFDPPRFVPTNEGGFVLTARGLNTAVHYRPAAEVPFEEELKGLSFAAAARRSDGAVVMPEWRTGQLYTLETGGWVNRGMIASHVVAMTVTEDARLLFLTRVGTAGVATAGGETCPIRTLSGWIAPKALTRLGSGFVLGGYIDGNRGVVGYLEIVEVEP